MSDKCRTCLKTVRVNQKSILCDICSQWTHLRCSQLTRPEFDYLGVSTEKWLCAICLSSIFPCNHISDNKEFFSALQSRHIPISVDKDRLERLLFNPVTFDDERYLLNNINIDPDVHLFSHITGYNSTYLLESEFNELESTTVSANNFSLIHLNCRSLNKNYDHIVNYINMIKLHFSIIACTETWLTSSNEEYFGIKGYNFLCKNRITKPGGGVGMYITEGLDLRSERTCAHYRIMYLNPCL